MNDFNNKNVPREALEALKIIEELLGAVDGVYLFGSAVIGGLQINSDVDLGQRYPKGD